MARPTFTLAALLAGLALGATLLQPGSAAAQPAPQPMVLTLDDGPWLGTAAGTEAAERHAALRAALRRHGVTAVMYVTLGFGADRPQGQALARAWAEAGHLLGNHTVSHADLNDERVPLAQYLGEIERCDAAMQALPGWRRWFRPTYLNEGHTTERRDGLRRFLAERGYRLARVDIDSRDWALAPQLQALLAQPGADDAALRQGFIDGLRQQVRGWRAQARSGQVGVLLMHDNLLSARWLDAVLAALRADGVEFVHPDRAPLE